MVREVKCFIVLLLICGTASATPAPPVHAILADGASTGDGTQLIACRWPNCDIMQILTLNTTNPIDGRTYGGNTHNITADLTGNTTQVVCEHKIDSNAWSSLNIYGDQTTFPCGDTTLSVRCTDHNTVITDVSEFTILCKNTIPGGRIPWIVWATGLICGLVMVIGWLDDEGKLPR